MNDTDSRYLPDRVRDGAVDIAVVDLFAEQVGDDLACRSLAVEPLVVIIEKASAATTFPPLPLPSGWTNWALRELWSR